MPIGRCWEPHAVSLKGTSKDCQCPWGSLRKPLSSPVLSRHALCSNHSQEHPSTTSLPVSDSAVQTHSGVITNNSLSYSHLGCTSVCSTAYLPARESQRKLFQPLLYLVLPKADFLVRMCDTALLGLGSHCQCCAHPHAQLLSWQCQDSPGGSLPNTTWPRPQITASKKQK